ncbi:UNVERIFIED_CONTAM: hypothetical protein RKD50_009475 [Streptomyces canus]
MLVQHPQEVRDIKKATIAWYTTGALFAIASVAGPALLLNDGEGPQIPLGWDYTASPEPGPAMTKPPEYATTKFPTVIACPEVLGHTSSFTTDVSVTTTSRSVTSDLDVTELYVGAGGISGVKKCTAIIVLSGPELPTDLWLDDSVSADADPREPRRVTVPLEEEVTLIWERTRPGDWTVEAG